MEEANQQVQAAVSAIEMVFKLISVYCNMRRVVDAYHASCSQCSNDRRVCAKCLQSRGIVISAEMAEQAERTAKEREALVDKLPERRRRTYRRKMERGDEQGALQILSSFNDAESDCDFSSSDEDST
jgi:UDP-N-acetylmuramyl pentapeptide synthase